MRKYCHLICLKILVFCRNGWLMENHWLGTHNDKMCADSSTGNIPNTKVALEGSWADPWVFTVTTQGSADATFKNDFTKYPTIHSAHLSKLPNYFRYFWKKLSSHVHCPWLKLFSKDIEGPLVTMIWSIWFSNQ